VTKPQAVGKSESEREIEKGTTMAMQDEEKIKQPERREKVW
jgi:hypothetical protein